MEASLDTPPAPLPPQPVVIANDDETKNKSQEQRQPYSQRDFTYTLSPFPPSSKLSGSFLVGYYDRLEQEIREDEEENSWANSHHEGVSGSIYSVVCDDVLDDETDEVKSLFSTRKSLLADEPTQLHRDIERHIRSGSRPTHLLYKNPRIIQISEFFSLASTEWHSSCQPGLDQETSRLPFRPLSAAARRIKLKRKQAASPVSHATDRLEYPEGVSGSLYSVGDDFLDYDDNDEDDVKPQFSYRMSFLEDELTQLDREIRQNLPTLKPESRPPTQPLLKNSQLVQISEDFSLPSTESQCSGHLELDEEVATSQESSGRCPLLAAARKVNLRRKQADSPMPLMPDGNESPPGGFVTKAKDTLGGVKDTLRGVNGTPDTTRRKFLVLFSRDNGA